jgi:hypothetical protein
MNGRPRFASLFLCAPIVFATACGGGSSARAPASSGKPVAARPAAPPPDVSPVPEPEGLVAIARVKKPEAILDAVGAWTRLPLPSGQDLVRNMIDDTLGDVVDFSQPVDGAVTLASARRSPKVLAAFAIPVASYDRAKASLGRGHTLRPGPNGLLFVSGLGKGGGRPPPEGDEEDDDETEGCVLAPAPVGGRLVCGNREALEVLTPYLSRTAPRQTYPSDVHVEVRPAPVREPLRQLRGTLPLLARTMMGSQSPAVSELVDASIGELVDFVTDTNRLTLDADIADEGVNATMRVEYQSASSFMARLATGRPERAGAPPAAFWHLPAGTDTAIFGRGADPALFDGPREIFANVALEVAADAEMPANERRAAKDLLVDRILPLFTGPVVYGKGFDPDGLEKASRPAGDAASESEGQRALVEQVVGWHLLQVEEPVTKVGPVLRETAQLWNRPAFVAWAKKQTSSRMRATMKIAPAPKGVKLPKDSVHLELTLPRADLPPALAATGKKPAAKAKPSTPKPFVMHVYAIPDGGTTWIAFGLDGKLVADKALAALASAPEANTLGKSGAFETLRDAKASGAAVTTLRGLAVFSALRGRSGSPFEALRTLPNRGETPIVLTSNAEPPSDGAPAGAAVSTLRFPRGAIEDLVRMMITSR